MGELEQAVLEVLWDLDAAGRTATPDGTGVSGREGHDRLAGPLSQHHPSFRLACGEPLALRLA